MLFSAFCCCCVRLFAWRNVTNEAEGRLRAEGRLKEEEERGRAPVCLRSCPGDKQDISCRLDEPQGLQELIGCNRQNTFTHYSTTFGPGSLYHPKEREREGRWRNEGFLESENRWRFSSSRFFTVAHLSHQTDRPSGRVIE